MFYFDTFDEQVCLICNKILYEIFVPISASRVRHVYRHVYSITTYITMGRYKKGTKLKAEDPRIKSGGRDRVITELHSLNITKKNTRWNSDVWATLSVRIFGIANG